MKIQPFTPEYLGQVNLGTTTKFLAAHRFYEKKGFVEIPRETLPHAFPLMAVDIKFYLLELSQRDSKRAPSVRIRLAEDTDENAIEALMKRSMAVLGKEYYSPQQVDSFCRYVCVPDRQLIQDGTY